MTPSEARNLLTKLPPDWRPLVERALIGAWGDGFGAGVARLPRKNPFEPVAPSPTEQKRKR